MASEQGRRTQILEPPASRSYRMCPSINYTASETRLNPKFPLAQEVPEKTFNLSSPSPTPVSYYRYNNV
jgi:hypothetical protein